jgi:pimeloyl-ACP methyl ester carboxylesterase
VWHYIAEGAGRPLVLLHGLGMSNRVWTPVIPHLRTSRRVIAFDIGGFGLTPTLPDGTLPTIQNLTAALEHSLRDLGVRDPVDMAGNSLGGTLALEAARRGFARSVVAISPAGLWTARPPRHLPSLFGTLRALSTTMPAVLKAMMIVPALRELALAVPLSVGSRRMPVEDARDTIDDLSKASAFERTFEHTRAPFSARDISVPVTVAFGDRDWILLESARRRDALPPHARWISKAGWGHVPMWIDPAGVAGLILG